MSMSDQWDSRLAAALVTQGVADEEAVRGALEAASRAKVPLLQALSQRDPAAAVEGLAVLGRLARMEVVDFYKRPPDPATVRSLPAQIARPALAVAAWPHQDQGKVVVAFATPPGELEMARVSGALGSQVHPVLAAADSILRVLSLAYGRNGAAPAAIEPTTPVPRPEAATPLPHLDQLLERLLAEGGSDLHLTVGKEPSVRVHGALRPLEGMPALEPEPLRALLFDAIHPSKRERFEEQKELDTAYAIPGLGRFRMNLFVQRGAVGAVIRAIPDHVPELDSLGLPEIVKELADRPRGLVLVTGPTGSGKSTTLAAMVDRINRSKPVHIMTVEDPIEHVHDHQRAVVNQREVGSDTVTFAEALRHVLRQDPDVILVGEMRDLETISAALTAAETGHLVFGTLHTQDAAQSVDRMVDVFPPGQQAQVRMMLSTTLQGIVCQQLLPTVDNDGRVVAVEVLVATPAIRSMVREAKAQQIPSALQAGAVHGMVSMDQSLAKLVRAGKITDSVAYSRCASAEDLRRLLAGGR
jgi:twitching motility protein PilT